MKSPKVLDVTPLKRLRAALPKYCSPRFVQRAVKVGLWLALPLGVSLFAQSQFVQSQVGAIKPAAAPKVVYNRGLLTIEAENCSLADILNAVRLRTGGTTEFPASAANERATVKLGPAPLASVVAALLLGSPFDYVIFGSGREAGGFQIVLSEKGARPETQEKPIEAVVVATPPAAPLVGENRASSFGEGSASGFEGSGSAQPNAGTQFMSGGVPAAVMAGEGMTPDTTMSSIDDASQLAPVQRSAPKEGPRVIPPGKGH